VALTSSNSIEKNPAEAFKGWYQGMSFSDTSQFLIVSRASCCAMRELRPELVSFALHFACITQICIAGLECDAL
jgi:hypothetical protein